MAEFILFTVVLLLALTCRVSTQVLAADAKDAVVKAGTGPATITDVGGNVIACSSQIVWVLSSTTYLDCVGPASTISTGSSKASSLSLITTTNQNGATVTELPFLFEEVTTLVTLISISVNVLDAPGATETIQTVNGQGSTISEVIVVQGRSTSVVSTLTPVEGATKTITTTNAQGSTISEIIVVDGSSTNIVTTISPPLFTAATDLVTTIPPGASIETLSSGIYTSDQWITTQKPGSSGETVIPIIVPSNGPPIAVWGIIPGPPPGGTIPATPTWVINIPGIPCFEIFGIQFGDCPASDTNPSDPSQESDNDSCTSTTATITTVSCATSGNSSSCTTLTTPTVGCSVTGSGTTTGSCVAKTTLDSTTNCCTSATVSAGSTQCAFETFTAVDMYTAGAAQIVIPAAQLWSEMLSINEPRSGDTGSSALCVPTSGPDVTGDVCICSTGTITQTISSYFNPSTSVCGYTSLPSPANQSPTPSTTPKATGYILTVTDPNDGQIEACTSVSVEVAAGYSVTVCAGGITTIKTASKATGTATSPAVSSTAEVLIIYFESESDGIYTYQYRAYDGTPGQKIDYCVSASPITFIALPASSGGNSSVLPTNQLPTFTTHGIKGCSYSSSSSSLAGSISCPGWTQEVQCNSETTGLTTPQSVRNS